MRLTVIRWYSRISASLGVAYIIPFLRILEFSGDSGSHGGSGDGVGLAVPMATLAGGFLLFVQALLATLVFSVRAKAACPPDCGPRREVRWHVAALILMIVGFVLVPTVHHSMQRADAEAALKAVDESPSNNLEQAIATGTPALVTQWAGRLDAQERRDPRWLVRGAVATLRLDNLKALQDAGIAIVPAADVDEWALLVQTAAQSDKSAPDGSRLATVRWLLDQGQSRGYDLHSHAGDLFDPLPGNNAFDMAAIYGSTGVFDLLVAHGADVNDCTHACPLWDAASMSDVATVQFLLAHGASTAPSRGEHHTTALGVAIGYGNARMVQLLLAAGARATFDEHHDDVIAACTYREEMTEDTSNAADIVAQLHAAHVRITADRVDAHGDGLTAPQLACIKGFQS